MPFYDEGLNFSCQRCSRCCRVEPGFVYLSYEDLTNLCNCFKLKETDFIKKYCRWVQYYDNTEVLCLLETTKYDCILWDNGCTAYNNRPVQCSTYPFWSFLLESKQDWDENEKYCPGINKGQVHEKSEIECQLNKYEENEPIHKNDYDNKESVLGRAS